MTTIKAFLCRSLQIGAFALIITTFVSPALSYAATYQYVNTSGTISNTNAQSSAQAIATAPGISAHSGVMLTSQHMSNVTPTNYTYGQSTQYGYINSSGMFTVVTANSSNNAFTDSVNIAQRSGVILINSQADRNMTGDTTTL